MRKMRPPKSLENHLPAWEAAEALEELAAQIRDNARVRPLVKWTLALSYWNPAWATNHTPPSSMTNIAGRLRSITYVSNRQK